MKLFVKDKSFYKTFFSLTIILALQNIVIYSVNLADNIMLGGYKQISLSAVALANQIQFLLQMIVLGIGGAMMILISQYWGKQELDNIKKITNIGIKTSIVVALVLTLIIFFFPHQVVLLLTNESEIIAESVSYLKIICFSYVFFALTNSILAALRSVETVKIGFIVSVFALTINVFLNYVLIYGNLGAPELGCKGAAIATLSARISEFVITIIYCKFFDKKIKLKLSDFKKLDYNLFKHYIRIGIPTIASDFLWGIAMGIQTAILGHMGAESIAANSIAITIFQIITVLCYAAGNSTSVIIGKNIGKGNLNNVKEYVKTLQILYLIIGFATALTLFLSNRYILSFYNISESTKLLASKFSVVLSISVLGTAYEYPTLVGIVRGGGSPKFALINDIIFMWCFSLPAALLAAFVFNLSPVIVFAIIKSDQIFKSIVAYFKVNKGNWIRQLT